MKVQQAPRNGCKAWGGQLPSTYCVVRHWLGTKRQTTCTESISRRSIVHSAVVETASAPVVQATNEQPPCMNFADVNRHNFKAVLPLMRAAIYEATFVAIDAEFTGLFPEGVSEDPLDDYEERYKRLLASADSFAICQFGLSAFKWHPAPGASRGGHWEAKSFNAYIFPRPDEKMGWDKRFLCQASSLSYLAEKGFDFNKMIHDGIGFLPLTLRDAKVRLLREEQDKTQRSRELRNTDEEELVEAARARVLSWLLGSEQELLLPLPPTRRQRTLLRLVLQDDFQLPSLGYDPFAIEFCSTNAVDGSGNADDGVTSSNDEVAIPGSTVAVEGIEGAGSRGEDADTGEISGRGESDGSDSEAGTSGRDGEEFVRLRRLDHWRPNALIASGQQLTARQRIEMLVEQSGFSQVMDILRDAERPVVGHNATLDLAYILSQFSGPLPRNWRTYKTQISRAFPAGLYDTKHIATQLMASGVPVGDTGLGNLYRTLTDEQWLRANIPGAGLPAALGGGVPEVRHAPGFTGYVGASIEKAHEAGFDAFMTGTAFARLLRLVAARAAMQSGSATADLGSSGGAPATAVDIPAASPEPNSEADALLQPLGMYRGRVHVMRSDLPYADMYGSDPIPSRPAVVYVAGFGTQTRPPFLIQRFNSLGFSPVQVCMLTAPNGGAVGAFVQLSRPDLVPRALQALRKRFATWTLLTFAEYYQGRLQQQQQEAVAGVKSGTATAGIGAAGRAAPRMIRTTSTTAAVTGGSPSTAEADSFGAGGKAQRKSDAGALSGAAARADGGAAAPAAASSGAPESRNRQQPATTVMNKRQRLQAFTQVVAAAASTSGAPSLRQRAVEAGGGASADEAGSPAVEEAAATFTSAGSITEAATGIASEAAEAGDAGNGVTESDIQPHPGRFGQVADDTDPTRLTFDGERSAVAGPGGKGAAAAGSDASVDPEAAKRAAERLRNLALAAQRLKGLSVKDDLHGGAADSGRLSLQRPGRPAR
ncbi:hypothetical protein Vretimale_341 [Volvox reticuliferus]|uniref:Uncharacterized protein n=1 Tax=Volvox reticuliferus TaxID=1737510 RepID=A0A8J4D757_9CHLO|nr:hypothetical protein Vretifemale_2554 [Volvox reticuliferus]GIL94179.1 hypothetical protein Vretimale_341 [Volvox reticuliferus]